MSQKMPAAEARPGDVLETPWNGSFYWVISATPSPSGKKISLTVVVQSSPDQMQRPGQRFTLGRLAGTGVTIHRPTEDILDVLASIEYRPYFEGYEAQVASGATATAWEQQPAGVRREAGSMSIRFADPHTIYIAHVDVGHQFKRRGLGTALFDRVAMENPMVSRYEANVATAAGDAYFNGLRVSYPDLHFETD